MKYWTLQTVFFDSNIDNIVSLMKEKLSEQNILKVFAHVYIDDHSSQDFTYLYKNQYFSSVFPDLSWPDAFADCSSNLLIAYQRIEWGNHYLLFINVNIPDHRIKKTIGRLAVQIEPEVDFIPECLDELMDMPYINQLIVMTFNYIYNRITLLNSFVYNIENYIHLLGSRESFMPYHAQNVADFSLLLYDSLDVEKNELERLNLYVAALLHDVGKLIVSDQTLNKCDKLTEGEYDKIKMHPIAGHELMKNQVNGISLLENVPLYIKHHHEWYDGNGYPEGLKKDEIPFLSRIIMISDSIDAMLSQREYKHSSSVDRVIKELKKYSGKQFDPFMVDQAINLLNNKSQFVDILKRNEAALISDVSLSIKKCSDGTLSVFSGSLFYKTGGSYLKLSKKENAEDFKYNHEGVISFFVQNTLVQYEVEIDNMIEDRLVLKHFIWKPADKYFSIMWETAGYIEISKNNHLQISIIRVGGNSMSFSVNCLQETLEEGLERFKVNDSLTLRFDLEIEDIVESFLIESFVVDVHKFSHNIIFTVEYKDLLVRDRDRLFRAMFRKQMNLKNMKKTKVNR